MWKVYVYTLISLEFSRLHNLHPWYWNSLLYSLISSGEKSAHFLQLMPFTIIHFSFHQAPIIAGWTELGMIWEDCPTPLHVAGSMTQEPPVTHPSTNRARRCLTSVIWRELVTTRPCATTSYLSLWITHGAWLNLLALKVRNFWKFTSYCSLKPLQSGMGEVVPPRTSPTLHPPSPPTMHQLSWLAL